jgi:hypothetical protein
MPVEKPSMVLPETEPDPVWISIAVRAASACVETKVLSVT